MIQYWKYFTETEKYLFFLLYFWVFPVTSCFLYVFVRLGNKMGVVIP